MDKMSSLACEVCGGRLEAFNEGSAQGLRCVDCEWSLVTTQIPEIRVDEQEYDIHCDGDFKSGAHIRAVAEVSGLNFLESRKALEGGRFVVLSGQAIDVLRVKETLESAGVRYSIEPDFRWG
ncbi:hypothetical protein [Metapseudomonas otitidis]|uniref:hypothetical protein n=1 Tax=Metapseudomonas otitidis TaxID=319939 RepID=UPI0013F68AB5|nr:hypothetical protein [Pseudomonas otitidis]